LTLDEVGTLLLAVPDEPFSTMVRTALCLGLRANEVTALKWGDFSPDGTSLTICRAITQGHITGVKSFHHPTLPVCPAVAGIFRKWKLQSQFTQDTDWVFANPRCNGALPYDSVQVLRRIRAAGKKITWHTLRATLAMLLANSGVDVFTASRLLRLRTQTTMRTFMSSSRLLENCRDAATKITRLILSKFPLSQASSRKESTPAAYPVDGQGADSGHLFGKKKQTRH
jgi:integrase